MSDDGLCCGALAHFLYSDLRRVSFETHVEVSEYPFDVDKP